MKAKILKCAFAGALSVVMFSACNSSKDAERTPDDHETVMNTKSTDTFTIPTGKDSMKMDSVRFPPPTNPDTNRIPPRKN